MLKSITTHRLIVLTSLLAICALSAAASADATAPPTTSSPARDLHAVMSDFQSAMGQFRSLVTSPSMLTDPSKRAEIAPKAIPVLKRINGLEKEFATNGDQGQAIASQMGSQFEELLLVFGDEETVARDQSQAADKDPKISATAKQNLMFADWIKKSDQADQSKLLVTARAMANESPQDTQLCRTLLMMSQLGAATPDLRQQVKTIAMGMQTPITAQLKAQAKAEETVHSFQDKPLVIAGSTVQGKPFSTADWKGKVILVDFWATWCGPCRAELPRVKKAYADFHDKGLEILGVSNDYDAKTLTNFVSADPGMPWPQLLDPTAAASQQWNPTTTGFGIQGIPTMFLIDKQGICKSVTARENFEEEIPKLLAE